MVREPIVWFLVVAVWIVLSGAMVAVNMEVSRRNRRIDADRCKAAGGWHFYARPVRDGSGMWIAGAKRGTWLTACDPAQEPGDEVHFEYGETVYEAMGRLLRDLPALPDDDGAKVIAGKFVPRQKVESRGIADGAA